MTDGCSRRRCATREDEKTGDGGKATDRGHGECLRAIDKPPGTGRAGPDRTERSNHGRSPPDSSMPTLRQGTPRFVNVRGAGGRHRRRDQVHSSMVFLLPMTARSGRPGTSSPGGCLLSRIVNLTTIPDLARCSHRLRRLRVDNPHSLPEDRTIRDDHVHNCGNPQEIIVTAHLGLGQERPHDIALANQLAMIDAQFFVRGNPA